MKLHDYINERGRGAIMAIQRRSGVGRSTLWRARRGLPISYSSACRISIATGGAVSIPELCDPRPRETKAGEPANAEHAIGRDEAA